LAFHVSEVAKALPEVLQERRGAVLRRDWLQVTDPRNLRGLGKRCEWSRERERTERDRELATGRHGFYGEGLAEGVDSRRARGCGQGDGRIGLAIVRAAAPHRVGSFPDRRSTAGSGRPNGRVESNVRRSVTTKAAANS